MYSSNNQRKRNRGAVSRGHPMNSLTLKRDTSVNTGKERTPVSGPNKAVEGAPHVEDSELSHGTQFLEGDLAEKNV